MKNVMKIALISALALSSIAANAEFIKGDWKTAGDSLSVVDSETGIEWLNLAQTDGMSINQVQSQLDSTFEGWRLPTQSEVAEMMYSMTGVSAGTHVTRNGYSTWTIVKNIMGETSSGKSYGLHLGDNNSLFYSVVESYNSNVYGPRTTISSGYSRAGGDTWSNHNYGVYLVSDGGVTLASINDPAINENNANAPTVPLPATLGLLSLAMAGLSFRRKSA